MQGGRGGGRGGGGGGGRGPFDFNDPFGGFGGFGGQGSLMPGFFGGRDPFDDPFFTRPFRGIFDSGFPGMFPGMGGGMFPGMGGGMFPGMGGGMFPGMGGGMFPGMGPGMNRGMFSGMGPSGFIENQAQATVPQISRGPIIEELDSDHEEEEAGNVKKENPRKRGGPSNDPYIEHPDDVDEETKSKHVVSRDNFDHFGVMQTQPQAHSYTFQSSSVTYGGANGAYYTSSKARRMGSDGVTFEESKEADTSSGKATHRVSKGLHNKGHSIARKLKTDGKVDTMQTLHNLNEDELSGFEQAWKGAAQKHMPGLNDQYASYETLGAGGSRHGQAGRGGTLPSNELLQNTGNMIAGTQGEAVSSRNMRVDGRDRSNSSRGRAKD